MINTKEIYNKLLNDERITELVDEDNILSAWPDELETFPCIIFMDENQSDDEYYENIINTELKLFDEIADGFEHSLEMINSDLTDFEKILEETKELENR